MRISIRSAVIMRRRFSRLVAAAVVVAGAAGIQAIPSQAAISVTVSDVSVELLADAESVGAFDATILNMGTVPQPEGSTVTVVVAGGAAEGCATGDVAGSVVCTAGLLLPGGTQSFRLTVTPDDGAVSFTTTATVTAALTTLGVPEDDSSNNSAVVVTDVYDLETTIGNQPSTVRNGHDTLLTVGVTNTGAPQEITVSVATGNVYDPQLALPPGCTAVNGGATVSCTAAYTAAHTTDASQTFDIAVVTPSAESIESITSTAEAIGAIGGSDSASVTTTLSADATAFLPPNTGLDFLSDKTSGRFFVALGSAPGLFLDLNEIGLAAQCGDVACEGRAPEAIFPNDGYYSGSDPQHPYSWDINYGKLTCNGNGAPKCSDVLFYIPTGATTPIKMFRCQSYGEATATLRNVGEVCLQAAVKNGAEWTFRVALLRDIVIPIIGGVSGGSKG